MCGRATKNASLVLAILSLIVTAAFVGGGTAQAIPDADQGSPSSAIQADPSTRTHALELREKLGMRTSQEALDVADAETAARIKTRTDGGTDPRPIGIAMSDVELADFDRFQGINARLLPLESLIDANRDVALWWRADGNASSFVVTLLVTENIAPDVTAKLLTAIPDDIPSRVEVVRASRSQVLFAVDHLTGELAEFQAGKASDGGPYEPRGVVGFRGSTFG